MNEQQEKTAETIEISMPGDQLGWLCGLVGFQFAHNLDARFHFDVSPQEAIRLEESVLAFLEERPPYDEDATDQLGRQVLERLRVALAKARAELPSKSETEHVLRPEVRASPRPASA